MEYMSFLLGFILLIFPLVTLASPAEEREETRIPILDSADEFFGERVNHLANDFDEFFATERADDELGRSRFRLRYNYRVEERALPDDDVRISFNLKLPQLEKKFKIDDDKKKKKNGKPETEAERKAREAEYKSRHVVDKRWLFNATGNLNASIHPSVTVQGRLRKSMETGTLIHRFVQEATWRSNRDGFRHRTNLTTDHSFDQRLLFRFTNDIDWKISQKDFSTTHGPAFLHRVSDWSALSYSVNMGTTVQGGIWYVSSYTAAPTYRRNLYRDLLYVDLTAGLLFPKIWSFRRTPFANVQLEMLFGGD
jgi:hypothetical protein